MNPNPLGWGELRHQLYHVTRGGFFPLLQHKKGNLSGMLRFHMGSEEILSDFGMAEFADDGGMAGHLSK
tara:strand:+ start:217 stop:423 length:207 start_codon:yes stop_codon:yes gene_type:complete